MSSKPISLLLVEDDHGDALLVHRALDECDSSFAVDHAPSLKAACQKLCERTFDLMLLDLSLPDSHMLEGVRDLHQRFGTTPIVVLTNLSDNRIALEALENGAQDYLVKGQSDPVHLERTIKYAIQRHQIVVENQRLLSELETVARVDSLTGMLNRYHFSIELDREWSRIQRAARPFSCVVLDVDFFKRINDLHGHLAGDQVLKALADCLKDSSRTSDTVARYGGEEFCAILPETDEAEAARWADRLRETIESQDFPLGEESIRLTVSAGVAAYHENLSGPDQLMDNADQALLVAKQLGRNQVIRHSEVSKTSAERTSSEIDPFDGVTARNVMSPIVAPLLESQSVLMAVRFMLMLKLDSVPVVNDDGTLAGLMTEEDLFACALESDGWTGSISQSMNMKPICFSEDTPARTLCEFLRRVSVRCVTIVRGERPVGVVSRAGLIRWQRNRFIAGGSKGVAGFESVGAPVELKSVVDDIASEIDDLQARVMAGDPDLQVALISKASRLQELLDESLGLIRAGSSADRNLGTMGHLLG